MSCSGVDPSSCSCDPGEVRGFGDRPLAGYRKDIPSRLRPALLRRQHQRPHMVRVAPRIACRKSIKGTLRRSLRVQVSGLAFGLRLIHFTCVSVAARPQRHRRTSAFIAHFLGFDKPAQIWSSIAQNTSKRAWLWSTLPSRSKILGIESTPLGKSLGCGHAATFHRRSSGRLRITLRCIRISPKAPTHKPLVGGRPQGSFRAGVGGGDSPRCQEVANATHPRHQVRDDGLHGGVC